MRQRLIDANALKVSYCKQCLKETRNEQIEVKQTPYCAVACQDFDVIDKQPTVDAVQVCHAFWYWDKDGMDRNIGAWICSACHNRPNTIWETEKNLRPRRWSGSAYCSNCGAVMDGKEDK